jgi:hypothetical protein
MAQRRAPAAILAVAAVFLLVAGVGAYARHAVLDEGEFADRAAVALRSDEVRQEIGARLGERLVTKRPELAAGEGLLQDAGEEVAGGAAFAVAFRDGAARMHRALMSDADAEASLRVDGSGAALRAELRERVQRVPLPVPRLDDVPLLTVGQGARERALRRLAPPAHDLARPLTIGFGVAGALLLALAVALGRRRAVWCAGLAVAAAGGLVAAGVTGAQDVVLDQFDTGYGDAVVSSVWDAYLADLRVWALAACAAGLVVAAAAGGPRPSVSAMLAAPASRGGRALRAAGLLAIAGLAMQIPALMLHTGLVALAAGLFYVAAGDLLRALAPPRSYGRRAAIAAAMLALIAVAAAPI